MQQMFASQRVVSVYNMNHLSANYAVVLSFLLLPQTKQIKAKFSLNFEKLA